MFDYFGVAGFMNGRSDHRRRGLSRRQLLPGLALAGAVGFGGLATALLRKRPRVVVVPRGDALPAASLTEAKPTIISRRDWGALPVDHAAQNEGGFYLPGSNPEGWYVYQGELRESYQTLILHHSAFYESDGLATLNEVQRLHREDRKWADIGYHFLVDRDGAIYEGRDLAARGVHTMGYNTGSAGLCLLGDFRFVGPAAVQWDATVELGRWLAETLALTHLAAHSQFNAATLCPGAAMMERLPALAAHLKLGYGTQGYVPTAQAENSCGCCCETKL